MARAGGSVLTPHLLKSRTGEFDLESISFLDLSGMGLQDISCVSDCMGLLHLDLAKNNISDLKDLVVDVEKVDFTKLPKDILGTSLIPDVDDVNETGHHIALHATGNGELKLLETLNVSCNKLSSLDGVEDLSNLSSLNVSGNIIRSIDSLSCLTKLENLKVLRLHDSIQGFSNPVCVSEENYKKAVCNLLPKLKTLDGERVSGKGADLYEMCDELDALLTDNDLQSEHGVALKTMPWNTEKLLSSNTLVQDRSVEEAEKGFRDVMVQCKKINEDADKAINNAKEALWNS